MPTYYFRRKDTDEVFEEFLTLSQREEKLKDPNIEQLVSAPAIVSGVSLKPDGGFRDVLKKVKSSHYKSNINTF